MIKIGLIGSQGKMGQTTQTCLEKEKECSLVWKIDSQGSRDNLPEINAIIDFSSPSALAQNIELAKKLKAPLVIGTTGLEEYHKKLIQSESLHIPILWAPNFSLAMASLIYSVRQLTPILKNSFTVKIKETHHVHKKDKPSGTALAIANAINPNYNTSLIESFREGEVIGKHEVIFSSENEELRISHECFSRETFASGAILAAKFLVGKSPRLYKMEDLFSLSN